MGEACTCKHLDGFHHPENEDCAFNKWLTEMGLHAHPHQRRIEDDEPRFEIRG